MFSSFIYSQKPISVVEEICMPSDVAKKVMMDLSRLDSTIAVLELEKSENGELRKKIELKVLLYHSIKKSTLSVKIKYLFII